MEVLFNHRGHRVHGEERPRREGATGRGPIGSNKYSGWRLALLARFPGGNFRIADDPGVVAWVGVATKESGLISSDRGRAVRESEQ